MRSRFSKSIVFLFVLIILSFSLHKFFTISKIINPLVYGISYSNCGCSECQWDCGWCDGCWPCPPPCPTPTTPEEPTPTPEEPTPTPTTPPGAPPPAVGGPPGPPHCGAETPKAPYLRSLSVLGGGQVELIWDPVEPATHYNISYGPSSGNYIYGVDNTGKVTSFTVGGLGTGTYCFAVRAVNDCAPGELSNERCTGAGAPQVLGLATTSGDSALNPVFFWMGLFLLAGGSYLGLRRS